MNLIIKHIIFRSILLSIIISGFNLPQEVIRVACVGNSITEGSAMSSKLNDAYPVALGRYLGSGYSVINCGVSGRTLLKKGDYPIWNESLFDKAINFNPNIVTIMLGTNDSKPYNWIHKDEFIQDYIAMIDSFKHGEANPQIYICLPLPSFSDAWDIRDSVIDAEVIPMIKKIADSTGVKLVDFNTPFLDKSNLMPDGIHPLIEGSDLIARIFFKELTGSTIKTIQENVVSLNKLALQGANSAKEVTDNDDSTFIEINSSSEPIIIDLGTEQNINLIQINFSDLPMQEIAFTCEISNNLTDWTTIIDTSLIDSTLFMEGKFYKFISIFDSANAKYLKFQIKAGNIPDGSSLKVNTIKVYETKPFHAPIWGWQGNETATLIRAKVTLRKTNNVGELIRMYKQSKENNPFTILSNYGSAQPLTFNSSLLFGVTNRFYGMAYYDGYEITTDTMIIVSKKTTDIKGINEAIYDYSLSQNYPNPFNPETTIEFTNTKVERITVELYDIAGRLIHSLGNKIYNAGKHKVNWDGRNSDGKKCSSGVYFYQLNIAGKKNEVKKMILLQ